jgi:hypothetical protein
MMDTNLGSNPNRREPVEYAAQALNKIQMPLLASVLRSPSSVNRSLSRNGAPPELKDGRHRIRVRPSKEVLLLDGQEQEACLHQAIGSSSSLASGALKPLAQFELMNKSPAVSMAGEIHSDPPCRFRSSPDLSGAGIRRQNDPRHGLIIHPTTSPATASANRSPKP